MDILPEPFDREQYDKALVEALTATEATSVYLDTTALVWLYRLRPQARSEFVAFLDADPLRDRSHIPAWSLHELNKHRKNAKVLFPLVSERQNLVNAINQIKLNAKLFVDDKVAGGTQWGNEAAFAAELERASEALLKVTKPLNKGGEVKQIDIQLAPFIEQHALRQKLPELAGLRTEFVARCEGRLPPGFEDIDKGGKGGAARDFAGANRFGDYVFWRSIIDDAASKEEVRTVVIISHDAKRDWVHRPETYVGYGAPPTTNSNREDRFTCPHPMLSFEINVEAGVDRLFIVSIMQLVQAFSQQKQGGEFKELSRAIQIEAAAEDAAGNGTERQEHVGYPSPVGAADDGAENGIDEEVGHAGPDEPAQLGQPENKTQVFDAANGPPEAPIADELAGDTEPAAEGASHAGQQPAEDVAERLAALGETAIADGEYTTDPAGNPEADAAIMALKSHNWYAQNPAVLQIDSLVLNPATSDTQRFLLGRNLYQSACGNAWRATEYLTDLATKGVGPLGHHYAVLFAGALFEAYFDAAGALRQRPKDEMLDILLDLAGTAVFSTPRAWIAAQLGAAASHFILYPGGPREEAVFELTFDAEGRATEIAVAGTVVSAALDPANEDDLFSQMPAALNTDRLVKILSAQFKIPASRTRLEPNYEGNRDFAGLKLLPWSANGALTFDA